MSEIESKVIDIIVEKLGVSKSQVTMESSYTADAKLFLKLHNELNYVQ